ncbi:unnamed protein product, partial [Amoebophrya sp. A120]
QGISLRSDAEASSHIESKLAMQRHELEIQHARELEEVMLLSGEFKQRALGQNQRVDILRLLKGLLKSRKAERTTSGSSNHGARTEGEREAKVELTGIDAEKSSTGKMDEITSYARQKALDNTTNTSISSAKTTRSTSSSTAAPSNVPAVAELLEIEKRKSEELQGRLQEEKARYEYEKSWMLEQMVAKRHRDLLTSLFDKSKIASGHHLLLDKTEKVEAGEQSGADLLARSSSSTSSSSTVAWQLKLTAAEANGNFADVAILLSQRASVWLQRNFRGGETFEVVKRNVTGGKEQTVRKPIWQKYLVRARPAARSGQTADGANLSNRISKLLHFLPP